MARNNVNESNTISFIIASFVCLLILAYFVATSDQFYHWFIIPTLLCGILITSDAVDWLRGRMNIYDPIGILGILGFHFFFLAPLLHVSWDHWMGYIVAPPDWRPWLGGMALLNFAGLLFYRLSRRYSTDYSRDKARQSYWRLNRQRFFLILGVVLLVTGLMQVWVYAQHGGLLGYIDAYTSDEGAFEGMGWIFMISESFPVLAMIGFSEYASRNEKAGSWFMLSIVLILFLMLQMLFGGLRGSRSNTVWALFWAVGLINFKIRPVSRNSIAIGMIFVTLFMYAYGFYKGAGLDALEIFEGTDYHNQLVDETGRTFEGLLLGDYGRSDVQAFLLYRLVGEDGDYVYAYGRTYIGTAAILIPRSVWPNRPASKVKEGTEALRGMGSYVPGVDQASNVYGLAGETMLNFGPIAVPFAFIVLGLAAGLVRRAIFEWDSSDSRLLLIPLLINLCFTILTSDSDNHLFLILKSGFLPFLLIALSSTRQMSVIEHISHQPLSFGRASVT